MTPTPRRLGWHFVKGPLPGILRDDRKVKVGEWLKHEGEIIPCEKGLHLSDRPLDALQYAPGPICCRVEWRGATIPHGAPMDKRVVQERKVLWAVDADPVMRRFARSCALDVIHLWEPPKIVTDYLTTGDDKLMDAARDAAWDAAWDAARAAARAAAWDAAWAAARDAAWDAAWDAARNAAWAAAWAAARAAARDAENKKLEKMLLAYHTGRLDLKSPLPIPARKRGKS